MNFKKLLSAFLMLGLSLSAVAQTEGVSIKSTVSPPHPSAMLDVESANKGLLIPRVNLLSAADGTTIPGPAKSLLVFNTPGSTALPEGFYYNAGSTTAPNWTKFGGAGSGELWSLAANNTDIYRLNGNVGIGTNNPHYKLEVMGATRVNNNVIWLRDVDDPFHGLRWGGNGTVNTLNGAPYDFKFASVNVDGPILFGYNQGALGTTANAEKITLTWNNNGNVTVNSTTTPSYACRPTYPYSQVPVANVPKTQPSLYVHGKALFYSSLTGEPTEGGIRIGEDDETGITGHANEINCKSPIDFQWNTGQEVRIGLGAWYENVQTSFKVWGTVYYLGMNQMSDSTQKKNIKPLKKTALADLEKINAYTYSYKKDKNNEIRTGVMAQEIETKFPDLVRTVVTPEKGKVKAESYKTVDYNGLTVVLLEAIKEQQAMIELMAKRIKALEDKPKQ